MTDDVISMLQRLSAARVDMETTVVRELHAKIDELQRLNLSTIARWQDHDAACIAYIAELKATLNNNAYAAVVRDEELAGALLKLQRVQAVITKWRTAGIHGASDEIDEALA
jgi:hypothetical protein